MNAFEQLCAWLRAETLPETDWDAVSALAMQQKLAAVLYKRARQAGAVLSDGQWALLRQAYTDSGGRAMQQQYQMMRVLQALAEAGVAVIALKGAYLGAEVYGDAALRPMQDVDLLVADDAVARAADVLAALGYRMVGDATGVREQCFHYQYEHLCHPELPVELHWQLTPPGSPVRVDISGLFAHAQMATIAGVETRVLCPEDLLIYLCIHAAHVHIMEGGLRAVYDVAQVVMHQALNWQAVWQRAAQWHATRAVRLMLALAHEWLAIPEVVATPRAKVDDVMERLRSYPEPLYTKFVFPQLWLARGWFEILVVLWSNARVGNIVDLVDDLLRLPRARRELRAMQERNAHTRALLAWLNAE